jgi:hypothetical protein
MALHWPDLRFPPINLWSAPHQEGLRQMSRRTIDERDALRRTVARQDARIAELEAELRQQRTQQRETLAREVQQAVMQARREWARHASDEVKAEWQAEALDRDDKLRRHAEEPSE